MLVARHQDREDVPDAIDRMSHYAVGRMLASGAPWSVADARQDRRYRTEDARDGKRPPLSIQIYPLAADGEVVGGLYVDHRFHELPEDLVDSPEVERWVALASLAVSLQDRGVRERSLEREASGRRVRAGAESDEEGTTFPTAAQVRRVPTRAARELEATIGRELESFHGVESSNPDMLDLFDTARSLASSDIAVLIGGETGTGKGLLARAVHLESARSDRPFVALTCGAIPDTLFDSELLGHVKGAFTGAETDRTGLLEEANGGTFFIDEVADLTLEMQTKLLRVLEDGRVRPLGGKRAVEVDVRIVTATSKDLEDLVRRGEFRGDLYFRVRGSELVIPPLRERWEDVPGLVERLLAQHIEGDEVPTVRSDALDRLMQYPWPGNVRELENEIRRLAALGLDELSVDRLAPVFKGRRGVSSVLSRDVALLDDVVARAESEAIENALRVSGGNKSLAAEKLGVTRKALYRRLAKYGLGTTVESMNEGLDSTDDSESDSNAGSSTFEDTDD